MHPIEAYLARKGIDVETYAKRARRSPSAIYSYFQGARRPLRKHLARLSAATGNEVSVDDLLKYHGFELTEAN